MSEYEATAISIRRVVDDNGGDTVHVDWSEDGALIELLGMVEFARDTILRAYQEDE